MLRTSLMVSYNLVLDVTKLTSILELEEPSFLRKLKSEYGRANSVRHERPLARPRKTKTAEDNDDEPTYVDEGSHDTLTKQQYEAMLSAENVPSLMSKGDAVTDAKAVDDNSTEHQGPTTSRFREVAPPKIELVAAIGTTGKRRIGRVVGEGVPSDEIQADRTPDLRLKKPTKKAKKIKLSFDDVETAS